MISPKTRLLIAAPLAALALAACSAEGENASAKCDASACTLTFNRGVDANVEILGVKAELVTATDKTVTMKLAGNELTIPVGENETSGNFDVTVQEITKDKVVLAVKQN